MRPKRVRLRPRLSWRPQWEGAIQQWARKFVNKNKWRIDFIHDTEDLMQDAYLTFCKIRDAYPRVMDAPLFMALFKTALTNQIHDHSKYLQRKLEHHVFLTHDVSDLLCDRIGEVEHAGYLNCLLAQAPPEAREAINALIEHGAECDTRQKPGRGRESIGARLRRVMGYDQLPDGNPLKTIDPIKHLDKLLKS